MAVDLKKLLSQLEDALPELQDLASKEEDSESPDDEAAESGDEGDEGAAPPMGPPDDMPPALKKKGKGY